MFRIKHSPTDRTGRDGKPLGVFIHRPYTRVKHGETEQQVIERLGTPKEFAENTAEQLGIDSAAPQKRKGIISSVAALVVAVAAFVIFAMLQRRSKDFIQITHDLFFCFAC